jgi:hypothetical protein
MVNGELRQAEQPSAHSTSRMAVSSGSVLNFATLHTFATLTASIHERRNLQEVVLVQAIHELLRYAEGQVLP